MENVSKFIADNRLLALKFYNHYVVNEYRPNFISRDDILSTCYLGLSHAANNYNPELGAFSTYAYKCMRGMILSEYKYRSMWGYKAHQNKVKHPEAYIPKMFSMDNSYTGDDREKSYSTHLGYRHDKEIDEKDITQFILKTVKEKLSPKQYRLIHAYYFSGMSMQALGNRYHVSRESISQRIEIILESIRYMFETDHPEVYEWIKTR